MSIGRTAQILNDCHFTLRSELPYASSTLIDHGHWTLVIVISGACRIEFQPLGEERPGFTSTEQAVDWLGPGDIAVVLCGRAFRLIQPSSRQVRMGNEKPDSPFPERNPHRTSWGPASEAELILATFPRTHRVLTQVGSRLHDSVTVPRDSALGERCAWLRQILVRVAGSTDSGQAYVRTNLARLILWEILKAHLEDAIPYVQAWDHFLADAEIANACLAMLEGLDENWTMARLAKETQIPRCTLDRRFRLVVGRSPAEWLRSVRLLHAAQWLNARDQSVESIGRQAGYLSSSGFRKAYQRTTGVTPSQSRK